MYLPSCAYLFRTIGVVGIDATLDEIENFLNRHQWGTVYSFLMNKEGETIFHPRLKPSEKVTDRKLRYAFFVSLSWIRCHRRFSISILFVFIISLTLHN